MNIATSENSCNEMLRMFHELCKWLGVPLADEKTVWATTMIIFLGIPMDGTLHLLALPLAKIEAAEYQLKLMIEKKEVQVKQIQKLIGLLNFLHKAIFPGRAFTRRMYSKIARIEQDSKFKPHHHIHLDIEFKEDCKMWLSFLTKARNNVTTYCRPFTDLHAATYAVELGFFTDSSVVETLGFGGVCDRNWFWGQWERNFIRKNTPSKAYLELYAVCIGVYIWAERFRNLRLMLHCDNISVVEMINQTASKCKRCMRLIHLIVLKCLEFNFRLYSVYVKSAKNDLADSLSRLQFDRFKKLTENKRMQLHAEPLPKQLWPLSRIWDSEWFNCIDEVSS